MAESAINGLVKMVNQIALNMAANGTEEEVVEQIAQHLGKFWSSSMKHAIFEHLELVKADLFPLAYKALLQLRDY